ncbi:hypothetical protein L1049_027995 [Liquidambar formosana]|uniref:TITAN-like protein n=1 Tax=Liquidambar formosana TaxID=63359 RepID=A0AAP0RIZ0_LIQFO
MFILEHLLLGLKQLMKISQMFYKNQYQEWACALNKPGKSHKLNPKRVGAAWAEKRKIELEMEKRGETVTSNCDANWLPNFGRVWQSGSRKESRKEFQMEKETLSKVESQSETSFKIQPYVSKRMRRDANE